MKLDLHRIKQEDFEKAIALALPYYADEIDPQNIEIHTYADGSKRLQVSFGKYNAFTFYIHDNGAIYYQNWGGIRYMIENTLQVYQTLNPYIMDSAAEFQQDWEKTTSNSTRAWNELLEQWNEDIVNNEDQVLTFVDGSTFDYSEAL